MSAVIFWPVLTHESSSSAGSFAGGLLLALFNGAWIGGMIAIFPATGAAVGLAVCEKKNPDADAGLQAKRGASGAMLGGLMVVLGLSLFLYVSLGPVVLLICAVIFLGLCFAIAWMVIGALAKRREATAKIS